MAGLTNLVPNVPLRSLKRVKIITSLGSTTTSYEDILSLIKAGANGLKLNSSQSGNGDRTKQIEWIRKAAKVCAKPVAIIQDLQGPDLRLGQFDDIVTVRKNQTLAFEHDCFYQPGGNIPLSWDISKQVSRGQRLLLHNGKIRTKVTAVDGKVIYVRAETEGILIKRYSVNLPDSEFAGQAITAQDRKDLAYASEHDIDYVMTGLVDNAQAVDDLKRQLKNLGSSAKVIAKISTKTAVDNLEEIVSVSDGVLVDRDNLAVETEPESVPIIQQRAISLGLRYAQPTIIASEMLSCISESAQPSPSEISDIATAVLTGADCLMLGDKTAGGRFPVEAISVMKRVIRYAESNAPLEVIFPSGAEEQTRQNAISKAIINLANDISAAAIVAETKSGATVRHIAARRPALSLIAVTSDQRVAQQLAIVYGARSYVRSIQPEAALKLTSWLRNHKILHKGDIVVIVSGRYPGVVGTTDTIKLRMLE